MHNNRCRNLYQAADIKYQGLPLSTEQVTVEHRLGDGCATVGQQLAYGAGRQKS